MIQYQKKYKYFTCHRYDINKKPISKVPIRYRYRYNDIGDISAIFSIYRPTSNTHTRQKCIMELIYIHLYFTKEMVVVKTHTT